MNGADVIRELIEVFTIQGERVRTLIAQELTAGIHMTVWDGRDDAGRKIASGVYLCRLEAEGQSLSQKMVLMK